jgi:hypothetical protein
VISRVHRRGARVGGLLRYLYGPGRFEEHVRPRLVAAWDGAGDLAKLEPAVGEHGRRDFRRLVALLEQPVRAADRAPRRPVWHCSMRLAPEDRHRTFSDATWGHLASQMLTGAGLVSSADPGGVRWVVVRHNDDHVHIVATLVREDGRTEWARNDYRRCVAATAEVARRFGLRNVAPADGTAPCAPGPRETSRARRLGQRETPRVVLRRRVRTAAAITASPQEFFARLQASGVLVKLRTSDHDPGEVTGYAVALPAVDDRAGRAPVFFSGGRLAPELSLPKLRHRWGAPPANESGPSQPSGRPPGPGRVRVRAGRSRRHPARGRGSAPANSRSPPSRSSRHASTRPEPTGGSA